jgi:competence protein ComEC
MPKTAIGITLVVTLIACGLLLKNRLRTMILLIVLFVACQALWPARKLQHPIISLLDVGQGLTMVVRHQDKSLVYDVGPRYRTGFNTAEAVLLPYLAERGVNHVDMLVVSHADNDHIGGYEVFTQNMGVDSTLTSRVDKIPIAQECKAGMRWNWGALKFTIISPAQDTPSGSNNRSCVLLLEYFQTRILITGDIEKPVEQFLLEQDINIRADILLIPHQGSKTSSTAEFIEAVSPQLGLIAAGYRNQYRHPHPSVLERYIARGIEILQTPLDGSIEITLSEHKWSIRNFREYHPKPWHAVNK